MVPSQISMNLGHKQKLSLSNGKLTKMQPHIIKTCILGIKLTILLPQLVYVIIGVIMEGALTRKIVRLTIQKIKRVQD